MAIPQGAAPSPQGAGAPSARSATLTPSIIILGADALLAARPASPGQLANACYAAGYSAVIPSSWGDELVAAGCLREIAARGQGSVVLCACPRVAERMRRIQSLLPQLLPMVAPPVAAARYLRARAGRHGVHITYVGDCPGGTDPAIDRHATPGALLRSLAKRGIDVAAQPREVEERLLRDARRFYSLPGGAPAPNWLYVEKRGYTLIEPGARDFLAEVAYRVSKRERRVLDLAPRLGCACSGVVVGQPWTEARDKVAALEPPRAVHEVLDHDVPVDLTAPLEPWTGSAAGGDPTVAISLEALAALYDADTKTSSIRSVPPPPVPRRRLSGGKSAEPNSPTRAPGAATRSSSPPAGVGNDASARDAALAEAGSEPRGTGLAERVAVVEQATRRSGDAAAAAADQSASERTTADLEDETASSAASAARDAMRISDEALVAESLRTMWRSPPSPLRRWLLWAACLVLAAGATTAFGMLLLGRPPFGLSLHARISHSTGNPRAARASTSPPKSPAESIATPESASSVPDTVVVDTTGLSMPDAPDLPRLPIRPMSIGGERLGRFPGDTERMSRAFVRNPAPVYTPGAAPIPRAAQPINDAQPPRASIPLSLSHPPTPQSDAEAAAIRAEIARRRHRVDSLRSVIDSLARKAKADSAATGAPRNSQPPDHSQ